jgi:hypothetical protein
MIDPGVSGLAIEIPASLQKSDTRQPQAPFAKSNRETLVGPIASTQPIRMAIVRELKSPS